MEEHIREEHNRAGDDDALGGGVQLLLLRIRDRDDGDVVAVGDEDDDIHLDGEREVVVVAVGGDDDDALAASEEVEVGDTYWGDDDTLADHPTRNNFHPVEEGESRDSCDSFAAAVGRTCWDMDDGPSSVCDLVFYGGVLVAIWTCGAASSNFSDLKTLASFYLQACRMFIDWHALGLQYGCGCDTVGLFTHFRSPKRARLFLCHTVAGF